MIEIRTERYSNAFIGYKLAIEITTEKPFSRPRAKNMSKSKYDVVILGAGHPPSPRLRRGK
jgi:hypothetical protein